MTTPEWDLEVRPRKTARYAMGIAAGLVIVFVVAAILLRGSGTGVSFRAADQVAMVVLGLVLAGGVLLLARPRLRVGPAGISIRNVFSERIFDWSTVSGVSFPDGASWARIDLPDDEYVPIMAIQANDKERAVIAVQRFRALGAKYAG